jgi:hypothetical protein
MAVFLLKDDMKNLYQIIGQSLDGEVSHIEKGSWPKKWHHIRFAIEPPKEEKAES